MNIQQVILLDETQCIWVEAENVSSDYKSTICDFKDVNGVDFFNCIDANVLTAVNYEAWATYFSGATVTDIELPEIF